MFIFIQRAALIQISLLSTICPVIPPPSNVTLVKWCEGLRDFHSPSCLPSFSRHHHHSSSFNITRSLFQQEQRPANSKRHQHFTQTAAHQDWIMLKVSWALDFCYNAKTKWSSKHYSHSATLQHYVSVWQRQYIYYCRIYTYFSWAEELSADNTFILKMFFVQAFFFFIFITFLFMTVALVTSACTADIHLCYMFNSIEIVI